MFASKSADRMGVLKNRAAHRPAKLQAPLRLWALRCTCVALAAIIMLPLPAFAEVVSGRTIVYTSADRIAGRPGNYAYQCCYSACGSVHCETWQYQSYTGPQPETGYIEQCYKADAEANKKCSKPKLYAVGNPNLFACKVTKWGKDWYCKPTSRSGYGQSCTCNIGTGVLVANPYNSSTGTKPVVIDRDGGFGGPVDGNKAGATQKSTGIRSGLDKHDFDANFVGTNAPGSVKVRPSASGGAGAITGTGVKTWSPSGAKQ